MNEWMNAHDQSVGDKEVGGEGLVMIEFGLMFNHGLSEDDVTIAVADCMSLYLIRRSNSIFLASMCMQGQLSVTKQLLDCSHHSHDQAVPGASRALLVF